jgi:hypothetical protein
MLVLLATAASPAQNQFGAATPDPVVAAVPEIVLPDGPLVARQQFTVALRGTRAEPQPAWLLASTQPGPAGHVAGLRLNVGAGAVALLPFILVPNSRVSEAVRSVRLPAGVYYLQLVVQTAAGLAASPGVELVVTVTAPAGNLHNRGSAIGTNLTSVTDWSSEMPFTDLFKSSRPWISGDANTWDNRWAIDLDASGNVRSLLPGQVVRTLLMSDMQDRYPGGRYVMLYDGQGTLQYYGAGTWNAAASSPGRDVVDVDPARNGIGVNILATNPADPVRNLRFVPIALESTHAALRFDPKFLARTRKYSVLRFMDWGRTNDSTLRTWAERPQVADARWSSARGVPVEVMVDLANTLLADPWFCIPHLADDNYVTQFATYVRDHLDPRLRVYIEHSNEVWNTMFQQSSYAQQRGLALGLSSNSYTALLNYHSLRSVQIFGIFEAVFGGRHRLVRVLGGHSGNPSSGVQVMDFQNAWQHADALAGAPYFGPIIGPNNGAQFVGMSVDQLLDHLANVDIPSRLASIGQNVANASARGLSFIAYEGGQHLVGAQGWENNTTLTALLFAANRHPRMHDLYQQYLAGWRARGGRLFVHFSDITTPTKWGSWGTLEYRDQPPATAPKFLALQSFIVNNTRWW